jgi:riboflavin kinase/FMN adenylyltransferase
MKLALGVFDGVHRGHQQVIERAHRVITFDPHPNTGIHLLTTLRERQDLIGNLDVIHFNRRLTNLSPRDFIKKIILPRYKNLEGIIVGHDFAFGYNREGNVSTLEALGKEFDFTVEVIPEYKIKGKQIRSSAIRRLLAQGDVTTANLYLGRTYQLTGKVVHGHGRGATLGFPTLNIEPDHPNKLIPCEGVYAGEVILDNKIYKAAIFIGECRTFGESEKVIEAHVLDYTGQAYGKTCTLFFNKYLRPEQKFSSQKKLIAQIKKDIARLRAL